MGWVDSIIGKISYGQVQIWESLLFLVFLLFMVPISWLLGRKYVFGFKIKAMEDVTISSSWYKRDNDYNLELEDLNILMEEMRTKMKGRTEKELLFESIEQFLNQGALPKDPQSIPLTETGEVDKSVKMNDKILTILTEKETLKSMIQARNAGSVFYKIIHFIALPWKILMFPVPRLCCFGFLNCIISLLAILVLSLLILDLSSHVTCLLLCKEATFSVIFLGPLLCLHRIGLLTNLKKNLQTEDTAIFLLTAANIFGPGLGFGITWSITAAYWTLQGREFLVDVYMLRIISSIALSQITLVPLIMLPRLCCSPRTRNHMILKIIISIILVIDWIWFIGATITADYGIIVLDL